MSAIERAGPGGNWLKVDVEKLGIKYLPISKDGEILFESVLPRLPSEGSRNRLRDRVMSVGSSIGAVDWLLMLLLVVVVVVVVVMVVVAVVVMVVVALV